MIKIEIHTSELQTFNYISKRDQKPGTIHKQEAYVYLLDRQGKQKPYPEKTSLNVPTDQNGHPKAYPAGVYQLHPSSFYLDRFGSISVAPVLAPLPSKTAA